MNQVNFLGYRMNVVDNGFVYVGNTYELPGYYLIANAHNVRKAGTQKGFGQLAFEGPQDETALDPCLPILVPARRMCHIIDTGVEPWKKFQKSTDAELDAVLNMLPDEKFGYQLAVVDNGFVYIGNVFRQGGYYIITNTHNVRKAGTERGFGELAIEGQRADSQLDPCPPILVPETRLCHLMQTDSQKWATFSKQ